MPGYTNALVDARYPLKFIFQDIKDENGEYIPYSYRKIMKMTEMPLIEEGMKWAWTLEDIKAYAESHKNIHYTFPIGKLCTTNTIRLSLLDDFSGKFQLCLSPNGNVVINWGDGSATTTLTGTSTDTAKTTSHTYAAAAKWEINMTVTGTVALGKNVGTSATSTTQFVETPTKIFYNLWAGTGVIGVHNNALYPILARVSEAAFSDSLQYFSRNSEGTVYYAEMPILDFISFPNTITIEPWNAYAAAGNDLIVAFAKDPVALSPVHSYKHIGRYIVNQDNQHLNFEYVYDTEAVIEGDTSGYTLMEMLFTRCDNLKRIYFYQQHPHNMAHSMKTKLPEGCEVHVPKGCIDRYTALSSYPDPAIYEYIDDL